jgi:MFS family permease
VLVAFTLASAACALVPDVGLLITARAVQGLVGAPMVPLAMSLILDPARGARSMPASAGRRAMPAVSLGLLGDPARALTLALACVASVVLFAVLFLAPVFLQQIQHHGATVTGLVLLPQGVVMGLASWLGSELIERGKAHSWVITGSVSGGLALLAASTLGLLLLTAATPVWVTTVLLCGRGVALGLTVQPLVVTLLDRLPASAMPDANTLFSMAERLAGSFGIALLATLYASRAAATGSGVTALRDYALVLTAAAAAGALAALTLPGLRARSYPL